MARPRGVIGPVFAAECRTAARRWQVYAYRAFFVGLLLAWLGRLWLPSQDRAFTNLNELAFLGQEFFVGLVVIQLTLVMLVAPAMTAGAICVEKARGTLLHVFVTDLTDGEIVLGKLVARLLPVVGLLACGVPVLALTAMMGGVEFEEVGGAYLITLGVAILSCSLALTISVWARKTHQALLATYAFLGLWVVAYPLLRFFDPMLIVPPNSTTGWIVAAANPFIMALGMRSGPQGLDEQARCFGVMGVASASLLWAAYLRVRRVVIDQSNRPARRERPGLAARVVRRLPGPPLDGNPVLWREWHRKQPTRWVGRFWTAYAAASAILSLAVIVMYYVTPGHTWGVSHLAARLNAWQVSIGLLLLSISAATALAEERDRGSLDVVMATPLSTSAIVRGKWWGTFAIVPRLAILPIWVSTGIAMVSGSWVGLFLMVGLILAYAAAITSLGLALATWVPRLGRAVGCSVAAYALLTIVFPLLLSGLPAGSPDDLERREGLALASPFFGISETAELAGRLWYPGYGYEDNSYGFRYFSSAYNYRNALGYGWQGSAGPLPWSLCWIAIYALAALLLLGATLATFDRCLGRIPEHSLRQAGPDARRVARMDAVAGESPEARPSATIDPARPPMSTP